MIGRSLVVAAAVVIVGSQLPVQQIRDRLASTSRVLLGEPQQSPSLRLRRWNVRAEAHGQEWLTINVGNYGHAPVAIRSLSLTDGTTWTPIGCDLNAAAAFTWSVPVPQEPAFFLLDTSEGRFRFDLMPERQTR